MLSERIQSKQTVYSMIPLALNFQKRQRSRDRKCVSNITN